MTKKIITIITLICLVFSLSLIAAAEDKTVYIEYSKEEGNNDYYPKIGLDWKINYNWEFAASQQFAVDADNEAITHLEIRRFFLDQELYVALKGETSDSYKSAGLGACAFFPLSDSLSYNGGISYTTYFAQRKSADNLDYNLLDISSGFQFKISNKFSTLISGEWWNYQYVKDVAGITSDPDYSKLEFTTGLGYQINEKLFIEGAYCWANTQYNNSALNANWSGFIFSADYTFKKFSFYIEYPFFQRDHTAMIGLSYDF